MSSDIKYALVMMLMPESGLKAVEAALPDGALVSVNEFDDLEDLKDADIARGHGIVAALAICEGLNDRS